MSKSIVVPPLERQSKPRMGCLFYAGSFIAVLGIAITVAFRAWNASATRELQAEMDRIRARGESLWFADLAPKPIDPDDDGTTLFLAAVGQIKPTSQAFDALIFPDPPTLPATPGVYEPIVTAIAENRDALDLLWRALQRPYFRLPLDYKTTRPITILLEPVQKAREFGHLLTAETLHSIGVGDSERAVDSVLKQLALAEVLRDEPLVICQYVRMAIAAQAIHSLETLLEYVELSPEQFQSLDSQLALMEQRFQLAPSVRGERAMLLTTFSTLHENAEDLDAMMGIKFPVARILSSNGMGPLRKREAAFTLRIMTDFADTVDQTGPDGREAAHRLTGEFRPSFEHVISRMLAPQTMEGRDKGLQHRQRLVNARIGLRLCRYRLQHAAFPGSLDEITDDSLPTIPNDFLGGNPLVYQVLPSRFEVYSRGDNGVDDGGGETPDAQESASKFAVPTKHDDN